MTTTILKDRQKEVIFEQNNLQNRIEEFYNFLNVESGEDLNILYNQLYYMNCYNASLKERIKKFHKGNTPDA